jgi:hypothetical protein
LSESSGLRELVRTQLQEDLAVEIRPGYAELEAGSVRSDVGFVWVEGFATAEPAVMQNTELHARIYLQYIEPRSDASPIDPAPLEDLAEAIRDSIAPYRAASGWLLRLQAIGIQYDAQFVEAVWLAIRENQYELADIVETIG